MIIFRIEALPKISQYDTAKVLILCHKITKDPPFIGYFDFFVSSSLDLLTDLTPIFRLTLTCFKPYTAKT